MTNLHGSFYTTAFRVLDDDLFAADTAIVELRKHVDIFQGGTESSSATSRAGRSGASAGSASMGRMKSMPSARSSAVCTARTSGLVNIASNACPSRLSARATARAI